MSTMPNVFHCQQITKSFFSVPDNSLVTTHVVQNGVQNIATDMSWIRSRAKCPMFDYCVLHLTKLAWLLYRCLLLKICCDAYMFLVRSGTCLFILCNELVRILWLRQPDKAVHLWWPFMYTITHTRSVQHVSGDIIKPKHHYTYVYTHAVAEPASSASASPSRWRRLKKDV